MPITITTHQEVYLVEHDTLAGMLRETADLVEELQHRKQGADVEIELEVGLIGCRLSHGIRVFYRAETEDTDDGVTYSAHPSEQQTYPALVISPAEADREPTQ